MAATIKKGLGVAEIELISGDRGEFSIWVGDRCVAQKSSGGYPTEDEMLAAVASALG